MTSIMTERVIRALREQRGVETLEFIAVGAAIVALALAVYPGSLGAAINAVITDIQTALLAIN